MKSMKETVIRDSYQWCNQVSRKDSVDGSQPSGSKLSPCFNVNRCAANAAAASAGLKSDTSDSSPPPTPALPKYAIVLSHSLERPVIVTYRVDSRNVLEDTAGRAPSVLLPPSVPPLSRNPAVFMLTCAP